MLDHSMQPERNKTIDAIKGFAIILVVLAHAIQRKDKHYYEKGNR